MKIAKIESFEERAIRFAVSAPLAAVETLITTLTTIHNERERTTALQTITPASSGPVSPVIPSPARKSRRGLPASVPAPAGVSNGNAIDLATTVDQPYVDNALVPDGSGL